MRGKMQSRSRNREKEIVFEYGRNGKNEEMIQQEGKFKIGLKLVRKNISIRKKQQENGKNKGEDKTTNWEVLSLG